MNEIMEKKNFCKWLSALILFLVIFLVVKTIAEVKTISTIGEGIVPQNIISVSGQGEAYAIPDIATVNFDVTTEAATVPDAQKSVTTQVNDILAYLKTAGIADKDVKTINYNIYPRYEYQNPSNPTICPLNGSCYPASGKQVLAGYDVTDSVQVTIRNTDNAGTILAGLGSKKVTNLSGLNFTIEHPDSVQAQARAQAINDAKSKAQTLASQLGVHLGRIVNYSDSGSPIQYDKLSYGLGAQSAPSAAPTPNIPAGQNKITSNVSITYEIY